MKTFKVLKKVVEVNATNLTLDRKSFARIALTGQFRKVDLKTVFTYPLGVVACWCFWIYSEDKQITTGTIALEEFPNS